MALGTLALAVFLMAQATGSPAAAALYGTALVAVPVSAVWGWSRVDDEVRERALRLIRRRSG
jgi:hypothetical protein